VSTSDGNTRNMNNSVFFAGLASGVSPPGAENNTAVIWKDKMSPGKLLGVIAHEIGHKMNIRHHGDTEGLYDFKGHGELWIALKGGQHSGDIFSFMIYDIADKFCNSSKMDCNFDELKDFPTSLIRRSAFTGLRASGFNVNDNFAGTATEPSDLEQLNIKSYIGRYYGEEPQF